MCEMCGLEKGAAAPAFQDIGAAGIRALFLGECKLRDHCNAINEHRDAYLEELARILDHGVAISPATRATVAAVVAANKLHELFDRILATLSIPELLATLKLLDAPRRVRQLKRRQQFLEEHKARAHKKKVLAQEVEKMEAEILDRGNLTGAIVKKVNRIMKQLLPEQLEFFLMNMPKEPWKELADMCHFKPEDFSVHHFLPVMFGAEPPADSLLYAIQHATANDLPALLERFPVLAKCYSYIRVKFKDELTDELKLALARVCPLEDVLWWYHEFDAPGVEQAVHARLLRGEEIVTAGRSRSNYGKLMERLLTFRSQKRSFVDLLLTHAQQKLDEIHIPSNSRVCVLGDASGSMEVAINTATIIASSLCVCLNAELSFFNESVVHPPMQPKTAMDVLTVTEHVQATGCTSPAAALYPYVEQGKVVDLFVIVTDEEENTQSHGYNFAELFARYRREVNPDAQVFLVSFLSGPNTFVGKMRAALRVQGIGCKQFRFDPRQPDLSRLPNLFASLALETARHRPDADAAAAPAPAAAVVATATEHVVVVVPGDAAEAQAQSTITETAEAATEAAETNEPVADDSSWEHV